MQDSPCFDVGDDLLDLVADLVDGFVVGGLFTGLADTGICAGHSAFDGCCE